MKNFKTIFFLTVFALITSTSLYAQRVESDSQLIGKWDLTIVMEKDQLENLGMFRHGLMASDGFPGWLQVKLSGFSTLVGYYVGYEGSARPIAEIKYDEKKGKYHFTTPPQLALKVAALFFGTLPFGDFLFEFKFGILELCGPLSHSFL